VDTTGFGIGTPIFLTPFAIERGTEPNLISAEIRSSEFPDRDLRIATGFGIRTFGQLAGQFDHQR
jgi:hypothetical protein